MISIDAFVKKPNGVIFGVTLVKVIARKDVLKCKTQLSLYDFRETPTQKSSISISMVSTAFPQLPSAGTKLLVIPLFIKVKKQLHIHCFFVCAVKLYLLRENIFV